MTANSAFLKADNESCPYSGSAAAGWGRMGLFGTCLNQKNLCVLSSIPIPWSSLGFVGPSHGKGP